MSDPRLDPAIFAWGLALGVTFGMWLRGTLDALFLPRRRMGPPEGSYGLPPDHDWRRRRRGSNPPPPGTKPQPPGGRLIGPNGVPIGYQPRPQQGTPNPPPSEP